MDRIAISSQWSKALHAALQTSCDDNMHVTQLVRASAVYCETSLEYLNGLNCSPGGVSRAGEYLVIIQETAAGQITWRQTEGSRWDEDSCVLPTHTVYFLSPTVSSSTCFTLAVLPNATLKGLMSPPEIKLGRLCVSHYTVEKPLWPPSARTCRIYSYSTEVRLDSNV